jgi:hypothetical protein
MMRAIDGHNQPTAFTDHLANNVVNLSAYRRQQNLYRPSNVTGPQQKRNDIGASESDDEYFARMKVNAAAFAALTVLVFIGIWLIDAIAQRPDNLL